MLRFLTLLYAILPLYFAFIPYYYGNFKIPETCNSLSTLKMASVQNCLHRCQFQKLCNVINFQVVDGVQDICIFYGAEVIPDLPSLCVAPTASWHLYAIQKAPESLVPPTTIPTTATTAIDYLKCHSASFKIYLGYSVSCIDLFEDKWKATTACATPYFCKNVMGYLVFVSAKHCMRSGSTIKIEDDCSNEDADFKFNGSRILYQSSSNAFNCVRYDGKILKMESDEASCTIFRIVF